MRSRSTQELAAVLDSVTTVSVCESNKMRNVGDHWSSVGRTVRWVAERSAIISLAEAAKLADLGGRSPLQGKLLIVGGSGLVGPGQFEDAVESLPAQRPAAIALWGIGHNVQSGVHQDPTSRWRRRVLASDGTTRLWPPWLADATLVGVRDYQAGLPWVPCSSCMLSIFDQLRNIEPDRDFVVLNHYERGIDTTAALRKGLTFDHITNNTEDLTSVLTTMARARVVVTNSYHAVYWCQLLGRAPLVVAPNSTRFRGFRWPVAVGAAHDWLDQLDQATASPRALDEARTANREYSAEVVRLARSLGLIAPHEVIDSSLGVDHHTLESATTSS